MKVALVQMNSRDDMQQNLAFAGQEIEKAASEGARLVVLPEYFAFLDDRADRMRESGNRFDEIRNWLANRARTAGIYLHAGSIVEPKDHRSHNASLVFDPAGSEIARYRKMHLFDIDSPNGTRHRESDSVAPGTDIVTYQIDDITVGCAICYDLRFPQLFRRLRDLGAQLIVLPAAFTLTTGKDHWEVLVRARAIETQTYFLAAAQTSCFAEGRRTSWGHSMVVDPWGNIVRRSSDGLGAISVPIDLDYLNKVRAMIPVCDHQVLP